MRGWEDKIPPWGFSDDTFVAQNNPGLEPKETDDERIIDRRVKDLEEIIFLRSPTRRSPPPRPFWRTVRRFHLAREPLVTHNAITSSDPSIRQHLYKMPDNLLKYRPWNAPLSEGRREISPTG